MQVVTLKLPIITDEIQKLKDTAHQFSESFGRVCKLGWESKITNSVELHHQTYQREKELTQLPSQLIISARMKSVEALKSVRTKLRNGKKASCPTSKQQVIRYDDRSSNVRLDRRVASLASIEGRVKVSLVICDYYLKYINWKVCSSDLCFKKDKVFLHVVVSSNEPIIIPIDNVLGVDLGVNRPAVTSDNKFYGEKRWKNILKRYFNIKRKLQSKGTDSAKRHLMKLSKKENGFKKDCDHVISRRIIDAIEPGSTVVLEDLVNIRSSVKTRKKQRRPLHSWSFARLQGFLDYKGKARGIKVDYVDPRYTSQKCSNCGHIEKRNRQTQSWFKCKKCGFQHNADLNASKNIRLNYIASKDIIVRSGLLSTNLS